ncbi:MAG TPA: 50S ribosomal protein L24 [Leucothrix sp.]|nr:50S ribosomal protein L24 [Leucothrix sp.]
MNKIVKNDLIVVISGKDKGRRGSVTELKKNNKIIVQGINLAKKHQKGNPNAGVAGGIVEKEMPIDVSNVMLVNPANDKGDRIGFKVLEDGKKVRYFKSNGEVIS